MRTRWACPLLAWLWVASCGPGSGDVQIFLTAEDTVTAGLDPGTEEENIRDGWTIRYEKFLITVGDFRASSSTTGDSLRSEDSHIVDLVSAPSSGLLLATWTGAPAIRFDKLSYSLLPATDASTQHSASAEDAAMMVAGGYSLYVRGTGQREGTTIRFAWGFSGATRFGACGVEGQSGFAVTAGGTTSIEPTIHGDHWFFTSDPHTTSPERKADWIAQCDRDLDGEVTTEELVLSTNIGALFPDYNLSNLPVRPISNAFHYFASTSRTLGHFNGDGDCDEIEVLSRDPREPAP